ncbi:MAG TPA: CRISPR-associated endonuclease Cas1 [Myxococcota bacterium]|nr:CRISPR-associated endonuclease Cas1 [Myxococcota bacterium]
MSIETPFFRVRWTLCARSAWTLPPYQNAILYALLCDAARGNDADAPSHMPEGLLLDAPEQCRDRYERGDLFAFGATLIESVPATALRRLHAISEGLARVGRDAPRKPIALGGNFDLVEVQDLVAKRSLAPGEPFAALGLQTIDQELERLYALSGRPLTIRFLSPLRLERPGSDAQAGHRYADADGLHAGQLLRAVQKRLAAIGLRRRDPGNDREAPFDDSAITLLENRLTWLDLEYGRGDARKTLGGALGRVAVAVHDPVALAALTWGQYARVGKNLHFGFGRYRIEELGPDPTECRRVRPLLDLCLSPPAIARAAEEHDLEPEALRRAAEELRAGTYRPGPAHRVVLRSADGEPRELRIPPVADRALQRLILARLGPALDRLFETSSFAWRRGLNRAAAARRIERLVNDGWHFAVRADFDRFFDRVPRQLAHDRLEACLGDDRATAAVWSFVEAEMPGDVGIPTGAPLSPLLGNLLLDQFDEAIEKEGGRLVRYADDFLILTRRRSDAERLHLRAQELAADLLLQLNADSAVIDLREPFDFLGYRFQHEERWQYAGPTGPRRVQELGWKDADRTPSVLALALPQETPHPAGAGVIVAGPGIALLDVVGDSLRIRGAGEGDDKDIPLSTLERLIVLGPAGWSPDAPGKLLRSGVPVHLLSDAGWPIGDLVSEPPDNPEAIWLQCQAAADPASALLFARPLVRAKLRNFAALLEAATEPGEPTAVRLRELAEECMKAESLDALRGHEGCGAAAWYRRLPSLLGRGFSFHLRVAPDAEDPVNVLLNMGHTMLYRHAIAACRAAGLSPAVGFLHASAGRYASLAADLQEPFRHLVERAVILATRILKPSQFVQRFDGPYPLVLEHHAAKTFHALMQRSWKTGVIGKGQTEPRPWLAQLSPRPAV